MMLAGSLYFVAIAMFAFAVLAATQVPESNWLIAAIFPVFIALIMGFVMSAYAWSEFGVPMGVGTLIVPLGVIVLIRKSLSIRNMFIALCAAVVVGLIFARLAFLAADIG
jgi:hypothetical protein